MTCKKIDKCHKVMMIMDKDMLDFHYAESIKAVCAKCDQRKELDVKPS